MPADRARSRIDQRLAAPHITGRVGRGAILEVMTMERALKHALVPLAAASRGRGVELVCEVLSEVGEHVLGERRQFTELVARAAALAVAAARGGDVYVRLTRQQSGFDPTEKVLVALSLRHEDRIADLEFLEMALPAAQRTEDLEERRALTEKRLLVVAPSPHLAAVQRLALRRFGAAVETVRDVTHARDRMREAERSKSPFHVVYVDDSAPETLVLLAEMRDDRSLGRSRGLVATALLAGSERDAYPSLGAAALSKPVLPFELRDAIVELCEESAGELRRPRSAMLEASAAAGEKPRRASGMTRVRLAAVLATLAVGRPPDHGEP